MVVSLVLNQRRLIIEDQKRIQLTENLRSALEVVSLHIRRAGEQLPGTVPALALEDGASGASDTLILRRNGLGSVLPVCKELLTTSIMIYTVDTPPPLSSCVRSNPDEPTDTWIQYFNKQGGPDVRIYVYNPSTKKGEFLTWHNPAVFATQRRFKLRDSPSTTYPIGSRVYAAEEEKIALDNLLEELLVYKDGTSGSRTDKLMFGVTNFQVQFEMADGSTLDAYDPTSSPYQWSDIIAITISISGTADVHGTSISRTVKGRFFPRNNLSN